MIAQTLFALSTLLQSSTQGLGEFSISPTRLMLSQPSPSGTLTLLNSGTKTLRYRLSFVDMTMKEDGTLERLSGRSSNSAQGNLKMSPREIKLEPGSFQRIRVLASGLTGARQELRTHLLFEPLSDGSSPATPGPSDRNLRLQLRMQAAVTIPIFLQPAGGAVVPKLVSATLGQDPSGSFVRCQIAGQGNRSLRGSCRVVFRAGKDIKVLAEIPEVPVYYPSLARRIDVRLNARPDLSKGVLEVQYREGKSLAAVLVTQP